MLTAVRQELRSSRYARQLFSDVEQVRHSGDYATIVTEDQHYHLIWLEVDKASLLHVSMDEFTKEAKKNKTSMRHGRDFTAFELCSRQLLELRVVESFMTIEKQRTETSPSGSG